MLDQFQLPSPLAILREPFPWHHLAPLKRRSFLRSPALSTGCHVHPGAHVPASSPGCQRLILRGPLMGKRTAEGTQRRRSEHKHSLPAPGCQLPRALAPDP